jgi:NAD-dependent SIR2 family protein deacetylase
MSLAHESLIQRAAAALAEANALVVAAGAGMGVDSGLPDFRGNQGFWNAYPPYQKLGLDFISLANPSWFRSDPAVAWGFYGHRRNLYRATQPHAGFQILLSWAARMQYGAGVFTSNVDGHFQRAGFDPQRVVEVHGAVDFNQCTRSCGVGIYPAEADPVTIDETTMRAAEPLPKCPKCGELARPNILMFGDYNWDEARTAEQSSRLEEWLGSINGLKLVIVECGAGTAVPTVRRFSERLVRAVGGLLVRLNVREPEVPDGYVGLPLGALAGLRAIDQWLSVR